MTAPSHFPVQQAVYNALHFSDELGSVLGLSESPGDNPVYDGLAPDDAEMPYVVIGAMNAVADDTKTEDGMDSTLTLHAFSSYIGFKQLRQIMAAVINVLDDAALSVTGHDLIQLTFENSIELNDPDDSQVRHGVMSFRVVTAEQ